MQMPVPSAAGTAGVYGVHHTLKFQIANFNQIKVQVWIG